MINSKTKYYILSCTILQRYFCKNCKTICEIESIFWSDEFHSFLSSKLPNAIYSATALLRRNIISNHGPLSQLLSMSPTDPLIYSIRIHARTHLTSKRERDRWYRSCPSYYIIIGDGAAARLTLCNTRVLYGMAVTCRSWRCTMQWDYVLFSNPKRVQYLPLVPVRERRNAVVDACPWHPFPASSFSLYARELTDLDRQFAGNPFGGSRRNRFPDRRVIESSVIDSRRRRKNSFRGEKRKVLVEYRDEVTFQSGCAIKKLDSYVVSLRNESFRNNWTLELRWGVYRAFLRLQLIGSVD